MQKELVGCSKPVPFPGLLKQLVLGFLRSGGELWPCRLAHGFRETGNFLLAVAGKCHWSTAGRRGCQQVSWAPRSCTLVSRHMSLYSLKQCAVLLLCPFQGVNLTLGQAASLVRGLLQLLFWGESKEMHLVQLCAQSNIAPLGLVSVAKGAWKSTDE